MATPEHPIDRPQYEPSYDRPVYPRPPKKNEGWRVAVSTVGIILSAFFVAFIVMMFVFRSYQVDGPSMQPTLHNNDRLIIWKLPRTWARITGHEYVPNRGDIIVFVERGLIASDGSNKQLIKRVIGLPGDRVVIEDGIATVYSKEHPEGFHPDTSLPYGKGLNLTTDVEERVDVTLTSDQIYVMGDNRGNSLDSRYFGPVDTGDIVGKLALRMFPIGDAKEF